MRILSGYKLLSLIGALSLTSTFLLAQAAIAQHVKLQTFCAGEPVILAHINDRRVAVGTEKYQIFPWYAFLHYPNGTLTTYQVPVEGCDPSGLITSGSGINTQGMTVGTFGCEYPLQGRTVLEGRRGYLRLQDGSFVFLTDPHGWVEPTGLNDFGEIVGVIHDPGGFVYAGFIRNVAGQTKYLRHKGVPLYPTGINNAGRVVGTYNESGFTGGGNPGDKGFVYHHGRLQFVQYTDAHGNKRPTSFYDISNAGEVLGSFNTEYKLTYFVYKRPHRFRVIKLPNLTGAGATAINSHGDVGGFWSDETSDVPVSKCYVAYRLAK